MLLEDRMSLDRRYKSPKSLLRGDLRCSRDLDKADEVVGCWDWFVFLHAFSFLFCENCGCTLQQNGSCQKQKNRSCNVSWDWLAERFETNRADSAFDCASLQDERIATLTDCAFNKEWTDRGLVITTSDGHLIMIAPRKMIVAFGFTTDSMKDGTHCTSTGNTHSEWGATHKKSVPLISCLLLSSHGTHRYLYYLQVICWLCTSTIVRFLISDACKFCIIKYNPCWAAESTFVSI